MEYLTKAEEIFNELIDIEDMAADSYPTDKFAKKVRNLYDELIQLKENTNV